MLAGQAYEKAGSIASESIAAVRTVASFAAEDKVEGLFLDALAVDSRGVQRTAFVAGLGQVAPLPALAPILSQGQLSKCPFQAEWSRWRGRPCLA